MSPSASGRHSPEELHRINSEIERFDMSEAAERLEAMAAEVKMDKGNVIEFLKKMETAGQNEDCELSIYGSPLHSPLPLHPTSIKQESEA